MFITIYEKKISFFLIEIFRTVKLGEGLVFESIAMKGIHMKQTVLLMYIFVCLLLFGCSPVQMSSVEQSGFLHDYSKLRKGVADEALLVYIHPNADFRPYDKILFDRVTVWFSEDAEYKGIDPDTLKALTDHFQQALLDAVKDGYQVVDKPGPGVLRVRAAITDLKPSKPVANTLSTILPVGWAVAGTTKVASGDNLGTGEAAAEFELLDSVTDLQLAAAVDRRQGGKSAFSGKWEDAKDALEHWARKFRSRLDELHHDYTKDT